jgi:hypothetical protein
LDFAKGALSEAAETAKSQLPIAIPGYNVYHGIKTIGNAAKAIQLRYKVYTAGPLAESGPSALVHASSDVLNPLAQSKQAADKAEAAEAKGDYETAGRERTKQYTGLVTFGGLVVGAAKGVGAATKVTPRASTLSEPTVTAETQGSPELAQEKPGAKTNPATSPAEPTSGKAPATPKPAAAVSPPASSANPTTVASELFRLRDVAYEEAWRRATENPDIARNEMQFGNLIDEIWKEMVQQAILEGRLPSSFRVTPTSRRGAAYGVDVYDTATGEGYDLHPANEKQVLKHMNTYEGEPMPEGTVIKQVNPIVYESPWRRNP